MNFIFGLLTGGLISFFIFLFLKGRKPKDKTSLVSLRSGLYKKTIVSRLPEIPMSMSLNDPTDEKINVTYEVEEVSRSKTKSKIRITDCSVPNSKYNSELWKKKMIDLYDNAWVDTSEIEWIELESDVTLQRDKKITQILK